MVRGSTGIRERQSTALRTGSTRVSRKKVTPRQHTTVIHTGPGATAAHRSGATPLHRYTAVRPSRVVYRDQPHRIAHTYHYDHAFRDRYDRLRHRVVWPRYNYLVGYRHGLRYSYRHVYPYYHRKYVFVSLGGYWPLSYRYRRYYWYGYHPYNWYGYYPLAREVYTGSYSYYTYNYYNNDSYGSAPVTESAVFEQLGQQPVEPDQATLVDAYFEEAVKGFEAGKYDLAVAKFARAMELAPDDMVLPFAYSQALMADRQYSKAVEALRAALAKVSPEKEGVFYPRGLYPKEELLLAQIDDLAEKAEMFSSDADLHLLLGYQLLGIGQVDQALAPLMFASKDLDNTDSAAVLLRLLEKIKTSNAEADGAAPKQGSVPVPGQPLTPAPVPGAPQSNATIKGDSIRLKEGTLLATLCAAGASAGIRHFGKC